MKRVKMAVIGAGIWGENHAVALSTHPGVELVSICDLNGERARALADIAHPDFRDELHAAIP